MRVDVAGGSQRGPWPVRERGSPGGSGEKTKEGKDNQEDSSTPFQTHCVLIVALRLPEIFRCDIWLVGPDTKAGRWTH